ncbi:hypothetical protein ABIF26_006446 [Bradyrhizobium elkanii]|uniref:hypothetical protein n=1 Tax=Bradyrhizobium elkanii TaxID=29448 RepID=UPI0035120EF2
MGVRIVSTVVTAVDSYDLTTLAVVKDELSITGGASDGTLRRYITSASAAAAQYCNRVFQVETVRDEFWPDRDCSPVFGGLDVLQLSRWPVESVATLTESGAELGEDIDFRVEPKTGQVIRLDAAGNARRWGTCPIVAQYDAGYPTVPADVADAVTRMVTKRFSAKGRDASLRSESIPGVRDVTYWIATGAEAGNLTPDVADVLDNYRIPVMA